jgi:hypothetical protein
MITTYQGVIGSMPGLSCWDRDGMQRGWFRVAANGLTAWRIGLNSYIVLPDR